MATTTSDTPHTSNHNAVPVRSDVTPPEEKFFCQNCDINNPRFFNSLRGLRIHNTKCHPNSRVPEVNFGAAGKILVSNDDNVSEEDFVRFFGLKARVGVLKRIPKGARALAAKTYIQLIRDCIHKNDLSS